MCDYSLMMVPNRLAIEGEELVAHSFQSGTTGFVSSPDFLYLERGTTLEEHMAAAHGLLCINNRARTSSVHSAWGAAPRRSSSRVSQCQIALGFMRTGDLHPTLG